MKGKRIMVFEYNEKNDTNLICNNSKNMIVKAIVILAMLIGLLLITTLTVRAAGYSPKTKSCSCGGTMTSYGYSPNATWTTISVNGGNYCDACGITIPSDEYHMFMYSSDRYYFRCTRCYKTESELYDNPVSEHYTNGIRDY